MESEPDAFAVLLSSQSQQSSKRRRSTDQKDKYVTCPICSTSVPKTFIQSHTEDCLAKSQKPSQPSSNQQEPRKAQKISSTQSPTGLPAHTSTQPLHTTALGQNQKSPAQAAAAAAPNAAQPPFLSPRQRLPPDEFKAMVSASWDRALRHLPEALEEAPAQQQQQQQPLLKPTLHQLSTAQHAGAAGGAGAPAASAEGAVDAFAVLKSAQAAQVPMDAQMFLEGRADGSWLVHWRLAGTPWPQDGPSAEAAWSCSINANLPRQQHTSLPAAAAAASSSGSGSKGSIPTGSVKLRLEVSTNIPPGFGTAICWGNPLLPSNGLVGAAVDGGREGIIDCLREGCDHEEGVGDEPGILQEQQDGEQAAVMAADAAAMGGGSAATRWRGGGHGVLISALQKSVRRGMPTAATRIALELLKESKTAEALARRLSIICLEDGLLHPQLPLVVWTMLALGKGYVLGGSLANALLFITYQMASARHRDFIPDSPPAHTAAVYAAPTSWHAVDAALGVHSQESLLVKAMLLRAAYGGMSCDKEMLLMYAGLWTARFTGCTLPPPPLQLLSQQQQQQREAVQQQGDAQQQGQQLQAWQCPGDLQVQGASAQQQAQQQQEPDPSPQQQQPERQQELLSSSTRRQQDAQQESAGGGEQSSRAAAGQEQHSCHLKQQQQQQQQQQQDADHQPPTDADHQQQQQQQQQQQEGMPTMHGVTEQDLQQLGADSHPTVNSSRSSSSSWAVGSSWLQFLRTLYSTRTPPGPGPSAALTRVTAVGPVTREDIPLAAVDFHVAPGLTQHLAAQPQVKAAARGLAATNAAVAARLSAPDGLEGLINSTLWQFRSSINHKAWLQYMYLQAAPQHTPGVAGSAAASSCQYPCSKQQLEGAAAAAVAAWSQQPGDLTAATSHPAAAAGCSADPGTGGVSCLGPQQMSDATTAAGLRVLQQELASLAAHDADVRQKRQQLMPLWMELAGLADGWSRDYISRRLY